MKIKKYKEFSSRGVSSEIRDFLNAVVKNQNWITNDDGSVNTMGDVRITDDRLEYIPVKFKASLGSFIVSNCRSLKSLKNSPDTVHGHFECSHCVNLESLKGSPSVVSMSFNCSYCSSIKNLKGSPSTIGFGMNCGHCESLETLEGAPSNLKGMFFCNENEKLKSITGAPVAEGYIDFSGCTELPIDQRKIIDRQDVLKECLASGLTVEQYLLRFRGKIKGKKFGL